MLPSYPYQHIFSPCFPSSFHPTHWGTPCSCLSQSSFYHFLPETSFSWCYPPSGWPDVIAGPAFPSSGLWGSPEEIINPQMCHLCEGGRWGQRRVEGHELEGFQCQKCCGFCRSFHIFMILFHFLTPEKESFTHCLLLYYSFARRSPWPGSAFPPPQF